MTKAKNEGRQWIQLDTGLRTALLYFIRKKQSSKQSTILKFIKLSKSQSPSTKEN